VQSASALFVPAGAAAFQSYGPWDFKLDELLRGPDGHIQAVVTVKNASDRRLPFTVSDLEASLTDANGREIRRHGNLYRVTPAASVAGLVIAGSSTVEPGAEVRGRLLFPDTRAFRPVKLRLTEPVRSQASNTYDLPSTPPAAVAQVMSGTSPQRAAPGATLRRGSEAVAQTLKPLESELKRRLPGLLSRF
jgi:hypothetical protein